MSSTLRSGGIVNSPHPCSRSKLSSSFVFAFIVDSLHCGAAESVPGGKSDALMSPYLCKQEKEDRTKKEAVSK